MATQNMLMESKAKPNPFDRFNNVLKAMVDKEASDLHISVGSGFRIRLMGQLVQLLAA